jgi:hypothetical protein
MEMTLRRFICRKNAFYIFERKTWKLVINIALQRTTILRGRHC